MQAVPVYAAYCRRHAATVFWTQWRGLGRQATGVTASTATEMVVVPCGPRGIPARYRTGTSLHSLGVNGSNSAMAMHTLLGLGKDN